MASFRQFTTGAVQGIFVFLILRPVMIVGYGGLLGLQLSAYLCCFFVPPHRDYLCLLVQELR